MARERKSRKKLEELVLVTNKISVAFDAALRIYETWESPNGPAVVMDVDCLVHGEYTIRFRLIAQWGKEAWT